MRRSDGGLFSGYDAGMGENPYKSPESRSVGRDRKLSPMQARFVRIVIWILLLAGVLAYLLVPQVQTNPPSRLF